MILFALLEVPFNLMRVVYNLKCFASSQENNGVSLVPPPESVDAETIKSFPTSI